MKKYLLLVLLLFLNMSVLQAASQDGNKDYLKDYEKAKQMYASANACLATYDDKVGNLFYTFLENDGWQSERFIIEGDLADANIFLASRYDDKTGEITYILSFRGTASSKDRKVDLQTRKVLFKGDDVESIKENAKVTDAPKDMPQVHEGFLNYVVVALEAEPKRGEEYKEHLHTALINNPKAKVIVTGHSLGGAAAIIYAASIINMGVPPEQIKVITFGSPAVGNEAFLQKYQDKMDFLRVYSKFDPIPGSLQSIRSGYKQFGTPLILSADNRYKGTFQHSIELYTDLVAKYYYNHEQKAIDEGVMPAKPISQDIGDGKIVAIVVTNSIDIYKLNEYKYAKESLLDVYRNSFLRYRIVEVEVNEFDMLKAESLAREIGADYVVMADIDISRDKVTKGWIVKLAQSLFSLHTNSISSGVTFSTRIKDGDSFFQAAAFNSLRAIETLKESNSNLFK